MCRKAKAELQELGPDAEDTATVKDRESIGMSKAQLKECLKYVRCKRKVDKEQWDRQLSVHLMSKCQLGHPEAGGNRCIKKAEKRQADGQPAWESAMKLPRTCDYGACKKNTLEAC